FSMPGDAHERRTVGKFVMGVGWADEPAYAGFKNGVQLLLRDASDKPVTDLPEDLKVEVIFGTQKFGPLALEAAFGKRFGTPGDFRAPLVPTRPGNYTLHFMGSLDGQRIDESFTSSDKTFDPVVEASGIEFPAKDPSAGELGGLLERLSARVESVQASARDAAAAARAARTLGAIGIAAGIAGLIVALRLSRRRASGPSAP
ncbi:MAG TPA: hypothetical protein VEW91_00515, partial [bacterium]|nr:hypothetical protein [bacterium]